MTMRISSASGSYEVRFENALLETLAAPSEEDRIIIADDRFASTLPSERAIFIAAEEESKTLAGAERVSAAMRELAVNRRTALVALGGGIVQDVAAFVASVYMRGIAWSYAPTTLLGMVDSCIGGKSSINLGGHKNLLGTIHPPQVVLIDTGFAATLGPEQRVAGLCEAAKICFARGPESFGHYLSLSPASMADDRHLQEIVSLSLGAKKWFVEVDEFDKNERLLLNFGHTFGHAIEDASGFAISHGIAVGLGMLVAMEFAQSQGARLGTDTMNLYQHVRTLLRGLPELPLKQLQLGRDRLLAAFENDKKHSREAYAVILPDHSDKLIRRFLPREKAINEAIWQSFAAVLHQP